MAQSISENMGIHVEEEHIMESSPAPEPANQERNIILPNVLDAHLS